jgi:kumamolisin
MFRRPAISLLGFVALGLTANVVCQAQSLPPIKRHVREAVRSGQAQSVGRLPATQSMRLVLVLPLRNQEALDSFLKDLYDPASPSYRHFLTVEEFTARFGPTQEDYDAVIHFAEASGLSVVATSRNRLNLDVAGSVASIEAAFHLSMGLYVHPTEGRMFYAPDREPTPNLSVRLWRIAGLDNYSIPKPALVHRNVSAQANQSARPSATTGSGPGASFLGSDMRAAYYGGTALTGAGQSLGLLEYYGTDLADLNTYYANVGQTNNVPVTLLSTDGTSTSCVYPACDDTEQTLDMTQALGMAPGLSSLVVYVGSSDAAIFNAMATASPLNAQLSSSWTWTPADPGVDNPYFQQFAAQGQNLFQASGDSGAWKSSSSIYPADDAYLTTVGGTDLVTGSAGGPWSSETAWVDGGGGISPDGYAIPSWQTPAANGCANCSKTLRNGPDVSANANFTFYVCADQSACTENYYGGTSFAAPMWAGYLALANQQAVANGQSTLGFINPALYNIGLGSSYNTDFHDITSGSNGYSATTGYDLATGWGSPNGANLINALTGSAPPPGFSLSASPSSLSVPQGSAGNSTITSTVTGGFNGVISLSASGQPAGVTVGFNPTSITGAGTSTMTMTVAASTATGTYTITVKGTSGSLSATTTVTLTVTGTNPNFTISASPTSITISRSGSRTGSSTITTTISGGFNSAIALSASGQGSGNSVSFTPSSIAAPGAGTSTMKVTVGRRSSLGTHTITITGKGGGVTHTTTVTLAITR